MHWILFYEFADDAGELLEQHRDRHRSLAESSQRMGFLQMEGAFDEPDAGAALVFSADDVAVVEHFVRDDPYVVNGLVTSWRIRRWDVVIGPDTNRGFGQSRSGIWDR